jgi:hypothetical protein
VQLVERFGLPRSGHRPAMSVKSLVALALLVGVGAAQLPLKTVAQARLPQATFPHTRAGDLPIAGEEQVRSRR